MPASPTLNMVNLITTDMDKTIEFCRLLGWNLERPGYGHAEIVFEHGVMLEWDAVDAAAIWNSGVATAAGWTVVTLSLDSRDEIDAVWQRMIDAGYPSAQRPFDAFWGSRFAVICDHDGNQFGLMSPRSDDHRSWPPRPAPA